MNKGKTYLFIFCCLFLWLSAAYGQPPEFTLPTDSLFVFAEEEMAVQTDTSAVSVREFEEETIRDLRNNDAYSYQKSSNYLKEMLENFSRWLGQLIKDLLDGWFEIPDLDVPQVDLGFNALTIILIVLLTGLLIFILTRIRFGKIVPNSKLDRSNPDAYLLEEDIHAIPYTDEIDSATQNKQYRRAIRLYYLRSLKALSDKEMIQWKPGKTNREYLVELGGRNDFRDITRWYEYVWYGEFTIDEMHFSKAEDAFQDFIHKIDSSYKIRTRP